MDVEDELCCVEGCKNPMSIRNFRSLKSGFFSMDKNSFVYKICNKCYNRDLAMSKQYGVVKREDQVVRIVEKKALEKSPAQSKAIGFFDDGLEMLFVASIVHELYVKKKGRLQ